MLLPELVRRNQTLSSLQPAAVIPRPFHEWRYNGRLDWTINNMQLGVHQL